MASRARAALAVQRRILDGLLALAALAVTLLLLECGVRALGWAADAWTVSRGWVRAAFAPGDAAADLGDIVRSSSDRRIIYELRPGLVTQFRGTAVRISSAGFRDREYPLERAPGSVRIFGVGDSVMFGWGVPEQATFLARLEERLNREHPARRWEVINAAVPGYNAVIEVETLRTRGVRYAPDLVVIDYVQNDIQLPHFVLLPEDWASPRRSFLLELVQRRVRAQPWLHGSRFVWAGPWWEERRPERVPPEYRDHVGWDAYGRALDELAALAREHGFEVVVSCAAGDMLERARRRIERHGFAIANPRPAQDRLLASLGGPPRERSPLALSPGDPHPTPLGHQLAADALYRTLADSGAIARLEARAR